MSIGPIQAFVIGFPDNDLFEGRIAEELAEDSAVKAADTLLLTVPSQLGVEYNAAMLETIAREIAPAIGWAPSHAAEPTL